MKARCAMGVVLILAVAPLFGIFIPWLHYFVPVAITLNVPVDGPPFSEAFLPLVGVLFVLLGIIALIAYIVSKGKRLLPMKLFSLLLFAYSGLALAVWLLFFGSRILIHFPMSDVGFYMEFASALIPHVVWIALVVWSIRVFEKQHALSDNKSLQPTSKRVG